jgi:hypothetical protein
MATFAVINSDNKVIDVTTINDSIMMVDGKEDTSLGVEFLENIFGSNNTYIQYFYSSNYPVPQKGDTYEADTDTFKGEPPFSNWIFNTTLKIWEPPIACPAEGDEHGFFWSQRTLCWYNDDMFKEYVKTFEGTEEECHAFLFNSEGLN